MKFNKKFIRVVTIITLIFLPLILIILPADFFDEGQSISLFAFFGVEDMFYSTGMTRAIMHLIHLDFSAASDFNKLSFIVLPVLIIVWIKLLLKQFDIEILKWL